MKTDLTSLLMKVKVYIFLFKHIDFKNFAHVLEVLVLNYNTVSKIWNASVYAVFCLISISKHWL